MTDEKKGDERRPKRRTCAYGGRLQGEFITGRKSP